MRGLPTVSDPSSQCGCFTFAWYNDGTVFGYLHPKGRKIPAISGERTECIQLMSCWNQVKTNHFFMAAASPKSFTSVKPGTYVEGLFFVLVRGVYHCPLRGSFFVEFHRSQDGVPICDIINQNKSNSAAIARKAFHPVVEDPTAPGEQSPWSSTDFALI